MDALPPELVDAIVRFCYTGDLYRLALVNRSISSVAYRVLYRDVFNIDSTNLQRFLITIYERPALASLVNSLDLTFKPLEKPWPDQPVGKPMSLGAKQLKHLLVLFDSGARARQQFRQNPMALIGATLPRMSNLRRLLLYPDENESRRENLARILSQCPFQLTTFKTRVDCGQTLVKFLAGQREIKDLHIDGAPGLYDEVATVSSFDKQLPKDSFGDLEFFGWSCRTPRPFIQNFLQRGKVTKIQVFLREHTFLLSTAELGQILDFGSLSTSVKRACFIYTSAPTLEHVVAIAEFFPNLVHLRFDVDDLSLEHAILLSPIFTEFKKLEVIVIASFGAYVENKKSELYPVFQHWVKTCKTLKFVTLMRYGFVVFNPGWVKKTGQIEATKQVRDAWKRS